MTDNLIFYGSSVGLGLLFSVYFWDKEKRSLGLIIAALLVPVLWTLILAAGKGTLDLVKLYDVRLMNYSMPKNRATFWAVPMFASLLLFGVAWVEMNRLKSKAYQGASHNGGKPPRES